MPINHDQFGISWLALVAHLVNMMDDLALGLQFVVGIVLDEAGPPLLDCRMLCIISTVIIIIVTGDHSINCWCVAAAIESWYWQVEIVAYRGARYLVITGLTKNSLRC